MICVPLLDDTERPTANAVRYRLAHERNEKQRSGRAEGPGARVMRTGKGSRNTTNSFGQRGWASRMSHAGASSNRAEALAPHSSR